MPEQYYATPAGEDWLWRTRKGLYSLHPDNLQARDMFVVYQLLEEPLSYGELEGFVTKPWPGMPRAITNSEFRDSLRRLFEAGYIRKDE